MHGIARSEFFGEGMRPPRSQRSEDNTRVTAQKIAPVADNGIYTERSKKLQTQGQQSVAVERRAAMLASDARTKTKERERREKREN